MFGFLNKWVLAGSLMVVFVVTLTFSYGPGYGGSLLAFFAGSATVPPEMSPSAMVTPVVTSKKLVTFQNVTNVTSVSPVLSPSINDFDGDVLSQQSVSPTPIVILEMSPQLQASSPLSGTPLVPLSPATPSPTTIPVPAVTQSGKININTADLVELDKIPEVGPARAQDIIDYRNVHGLFQRIEDIQRVKGIGDGPRFQKMKDYITVE